MKIKCEKCGKDITIECCSQIESYSVGKTKCPDCNTYQKRYISEADILLFFGINECIYTIFTFICVFIFNLENMWLGLVMMILLFIAYYFVSKSLATYIYLNAPFKKDIKNKVFEEDKLQIKKAQTWQFTIFFVLVITGLTLESEASKFFLYILPVVPLITFIKLYFQLKYEKKK